MRGLVAIVAFAAACGATETSRAPAGPAGPPPECRVDADCGDPTPCEDRRCDAGKCRRDAFAKDTPARRQTAHDCRRIVCDEHGAAIVRADDGDPPADDHNECTIERCDGDQAVVTEAPLQSACEHDGVCTRNRECVHVGPLAGGSSEICTISGPKKQVACWTSFDQRSRGPMTTIAPGVHDVVELAVAASHTCARTTSGAVECWGQPFAVGVQRDAEITSDKRVTVAGLGKVTALAASDVGTCALVDGGAVKCWGSNVEGGGAPGEDTPVLSTVSNLEATAISAFNTRSCAVDRAGKVRCWGDLSTIGGVAPLTSPHVVAGVADAVAIGVGGQVDCALKKDGTVVCWGINYQAGGPPVTIAPRPRKNAKDVVELAMTSAGGCVRTKRSEVFCFPDFQPATPHPDLAGATSLVGGAVGILARMPDGRALVTNVYDGSGSGPVEW